MAGRQNHRQGDKRPGQTCKHRVKVRGTAWDKRIMCGTYRSRLLAAFCSAGLCKAKTSAAKMWRSAARITRGRIQRT
jgi:hypothetical protein